MDDPGNPTVNFHGEKRSNTTHESTTDPEPRLYCKGLGKEAKLCYMGHALMDNRHGLIVQARLTIASGTAEAEAAIEMLKQVKRKGIHPKTVGADKWYDQNKVVTALRSLKITPHVAQKDDETGHGHRLADNPPCRIFDQPEEAKTGRADLWMGQNDCPFAQGSSSWKTKSCLALYVHSLRSSNIMRISKSSVSETRNEKKCLLLFQLHRHRTKNDD